MKLEFSIEFILLVLICSSVDTIFKHHLLQECQLMWFDCIPKNTSILFKCKCL